MFKFLAIKLTIFTLIIFSSNSAMAHNMPDDIKFDKFTEAIKTQMKLTKLGLDGVYPMDFHTYNLEKESVPNLYWSSGILSMLAGIPSKYGDSDREGIEVTVFREGKDYIIKCDTLHTKESEIEADGIDSNNILWKYEVNFYDCVVENPRNGRTDFINLLNTNWTESSRY